MLLAQSSAAALALITYDVMDAWALLPVLALLILIGQSNGKLGEVREAYSSTVAVLVEAAESQTPRLVGHGGRVAEIAGRVGYACGMSRGQVERVELAGMLHDIGCIGLSEQPESLDDATGSSARIVEDIGYLEAVLPILEVIDGLDGAHATDDVVLAAYVVSLASDIDEMASPGGDVLIHSRAASVGSLVPSRDKARVAGAAIALGYAVPAIA